MHRQPLLQLLEQHRPFDVHEQEARNRIVDFVRSTPACFERSHEAGHITGSAWVINCDHRRTLLTHHRKLDKWLQLGGHVDGQPDVLAAALREAREESGIECIEPIRKNIFDVDVHWIPPRNQELGHYHHDIRFLVRVTDPSRERSIIISDESHDLRWFSIDDFQPVDADESVLRMWTKWRQVLSNGKPEEDFQR